MYNITDNITEKYKKTLEEALAKLGIKAPESYNFDMDGYMTWGNINRFWITKLGSYFALGDYDSGISAIGGEEPMTEITKNILNEKIRRVEEAFSRHDEFVSKEFTDFFPKLKKSDINHPYLLRNQVEAYDLKQSERTLVFAVHDTNGKIWNFYFIDENGKGKYVRDGKKHACYFAIGKLKNKKIFVCDNYVAGAKIHEKTGESVAIAFDKENLEPVKKALLSKYHGYEITIASDIDIKEIAPSAETNEAIDVFDQYNTDVCTSKSENSQEKCDSDNLTEQVTTEQAKEEVEPTVNDVENEEEIPEGFKLKDEGVFKIDDEKKDHKVSDKIEILAKARDIESKNWSKVIRFNDPDGNTKTLLLSNSKFITSGNELEEILASEGLYISKPKELKIYINNYKTKKRALSVDRIGWCNNVFVFPDGTIIGNSKEMIFFQGYNRLNEFQTMGTLKDWRDNVGKYCQGNSRLILAVGAAFAGTLLHITSQENGGIHFVGNSTIGKSTILNVACSVYGNRSFMKQWRATDNGLEGIAATRNDTLLVLDELGQLGDTGKAGEIAYMLGNGDGKVRSNKNGTAKKSNSWRALYLSSGEKDFNDCALESKRKIMAGQDIRFLSIPARPTNNSYGAFETVHDKETGKAFSEYLNSAVNEYHGTASREFIQCIVNDGFSKIQKDFKDFLIKAEKTYLPADANNQVKRAFNRFMLIAFAGEYATANNITGWSKNDSLNGCVTCFNDWIQERGGVKDLEPQNLLKQVRNFLEQYSDSRFLDMNGMSRYIPNIAGYKRKDKEKTNYFVLPGVFEQEVCRNINFNQAKEILLRKGWLEDIQSETKSFNGDKKRVYTLTDKILSDEDVDK